MIQRALLASALLLACVAAARADPLRIEARTQHVEVFGTTTDGTPKNIGGVPLAPGRTYELEARVVARRTGGTAGTAEDGGSYWRRATFQGTGPTQIGVQQSLGEIENQAGWTAVFAIVGSTVQLQVTGATDNIVAWHALIIVRDVGG